MKNGISVIFLDIDGVLNKQCALPTSNTIKVKGGRLDSGCLDAFQSLLDTTGAKVVISSTWRSKNIPYGELLDGSGLQVDIIGETPLLGRHCFRGNEIWAWVDENVDVLGVSSPHNFHQYLILDDSSDILYWQKNNFYRTEGDAGLTGVGAYRAARQLKSFVNLV
tara:strand:+ start:1871 stop:2365 length:495 start_codon:yes stop_codon:yes gene_type:complete